jgi:hypothetical protein
MTFSTGKGSQSTRKCQKSTKELFYRTKNFWVFSTFSKKSEKMQKMTIFLIKKSQSEKCQKSKKSHEWAIRIFAFLTQKVNFEDPSVQLKFLQISYG